MPSLVMRAPHGSLLQQSNDRVVLRQRRFADALGIPWGISEAAYNARDTALNYQYSNFGVPGLGFKRGLSENLVVAPYATALAAMVDPRARSRTSLAWKSWGRSAPTASMNRSTSRQPGYLRASDTSWCGLGWLTIRV